METKRSAFHPPEVSVPGGVYLCQVSEKVSCGACCGLYNRPDPSRGVLYGLLRRRTRRFREIPRVQKTPPDRVPP